MPDNSIQTFTKTLIDITPINRYINAILIDLYANHPELQEELFQSLQQAADNKHTDGVNNIFAGSNLPDYPNNCTIDDFINRLEGSAHNPDPSTVITMSEQDRKKLEPYISLQALYTERPNLILYGSPKCGKEMAAIGLADKIGHSNIDFKYIDYHHLIQDVLLLHYRESSANNAYDDLSSCSVLIINDFASMKIDETLADRLYYLIYDRNEKHMKWIHQPKVRRNKMHATFVTTDRNLNDWPKFFPGDEAKAKQIIVQLYGYGSLIHIEKKEKEQSNTVTSS